MRFGCFTIEVVVRATKDPARGKSDIRKAWYNIVVISENSPYADADRTDAHVNNPRCGRPDLW